MITKENYSKEIGLLLKKKQIDPVADDIKQQLDELMPFYGDTKEVRDIIEQAIELLNENVELRKKNSGTTESEEEKANKLKLIQIRARARARSLELLKI